LKTQTLSEPAPPSPQRIERQSLHDAIVSRLRDMIAQGDLAPGSKVHETNVCQMLNISRTPLREALKFLASEGLVELIPNRGAIVRKLTAKEARDTLTVLATLESLAGTLACERASDDDIAHIRSLHERMCDHYAARDRLSYFNDNQEIHTRIVQLADNEALAFTHRTLQSRLRRIRFIGSDQTEKWADALADHEQIITALQARDGQLLSRRLRDHLEATWERVKDSF
jgi:DNA-binding GntR family transcriptional regulator